MLFGSLCGVVVWAVAWGVALTDSRGLVITTLPGFALGLLCASLARHAWGGAANRVRVAATALFLAIAIIFVAFLTPVIVNDAEFLDVYSSAIPGFVLGVGGVFVGWLAWWGAVEPLPARAKQAVEAEAAEVVVPCAICVQPVLAQVRHECAHGCGRVFHAGCHRAKASTYRGDPNKCATCGVRVA